WAFKDGWPAEVFFVSPSEARRDSITRVIAERESSDKYKFRARALTLAEARRVLCRAPYGADQPPGTTRQGGRTPAVAPAPPSASADIPARTAPRSAFAAVVCPSVASS